MRLSSSRGSLTNHHRIKLRDAKLRAVPAGLAVDANPQRLFVANVWGNRVTRVDLSAAAGGGGHSAGNKRCAASGSTGRGIERLRHRCRDQARGGRRFTRRGPDGAFPYACRLDEKRQRLYVSLWAQAAVAVIDLKSGQVIARWPAQEHPCEMALTRSGKRLFVANASRNTVTVLDTESGRALETIWAALYPQAPPGSTPNSLALSPDEKTLFVANADNNIVAVFDVATPGKSRSLGFIPGGLVSDIGAGDAGRQASAGGQRQRDHAQGQPARAAARHQTPDPVRPCNTSRGSSRAP